MWDILKHDVRSGSGAIMAKLCLAFLLGLAGVFALVVAVEPYVSPLILWPPLVLMLVLGLHAAGRRRLWERYGKMPPLQGLDVRQVRHRLLRNQLNRSYERRLRTNSSRDRGVARI